MSGESIGIIYPPPELRNIVDKTASFVARNGPEFESRIQLNEQNNPKFNFLKPGDPYHAYYQHKVREFKDGSKGGEISAPPSSSSVPSNHQSAQQVQQNKMSKQLEMFVETAFVPREPPPEFEFISDPPSLSALDLDVVKLTAQFVAIHGRSFLTNLMNREQRNYQFDFLRPQHGLFSYFTQLVEQYSKIVMPSLNLVHDLRKELDEPKCMMDKVKYRLEWTKIREAEQRREQEEAERERIQYAQIDWHDFVVVETVDYQPHEQGIFPPPTTPEQVGSRILLQQRIEEQGDAMEMDVESDEEDEGKKNEEAQPIKETLPPPLPPQLDNVLIRKDYNPKAKIVAPAVQSKDAWVISPITGEKIPAEKLQDHMRFGLLDSRWVEQRDRAIQEKMEQEDVYAPGSAIESSLKQMAERRTDIFGSGNEETAIGKKIGEEEVKKPEKVTWDGYTASMEAVTRSARANITIQDQIQQIHKMKGLLPEDDKDKIGPTLPSTSLSMNPNIISAPPVNSQTTVNKPQPPSLPIVTTLPQTLLPSNPALSNLSNLNNQQKPPTMRPQTHQHLLHTHAHTAPQSTPILLTQTPSASPYMVTPNPLMVGVYGLQEMTQHTLTPNLLVPGLPPMPPMTLNLPPLEDEPPAKKGRGEESLVPEADFMKHNAGPVTFNIQAPLVADKPEWNLNGQTITMTLPITDMVSVIKAKIFDQIKLPPGKQKLQYDGMFIKDSNTLAFYNFTKNCTVTLALKERGGRKK